MELLKKLGWRLAIFFLVFAFLTKNSQAYLDIGTGSYIIQMLVAGLFGGLLAIKIFWRTIFNFFKKTLSKNSKSDGTKQQ